MKIKVSKRAKKQLEIITKYFMLLQVEKDNLEAAACIDNGVVIETAIDLLYETLEVDIKNTIKGYRG